MITLFDVAIAGIIGLMGYRLWFGTSSMAARTVALLCLSLLAWTLVGP